MIHWHFWDYRDISLWLFWHFFSIILTPESLPTRPISKILRFDELMKDILTLQKWSKLIHYWWWLYRLKLKSVEIEILMFRILNLTFVNFVIKCFVNRLINSLKVQNIKIFTSTHILTSDNVTTINNEPNCFIFEVLEFDSLIR